MHLREPAVEEFSLPGFRGQVATAYRPLDLAAAVERLTDPASARETLHWGRNYLYTQLLDSAPGPLEVVVKQTRNQGWRGRLERRLRGSKATRSWRAALALQRATIPTPEPVMVIESRRPDGPSFFVSRRLRDFFEVRYFLRARNQGKEAEMFPQVEPEVLLRAIASLLRRLHRAGIWHRDVSIGNLLVRYEEPESPEPTIYLVDLNRARPGVRLTVGRRTRDLSRLALLRPEDRELLLRCYWREEPSGMLGKRALYGLHFHGFLIKNRVKAGLRRPFHLLRDWLLPRRPHAHIPPAPERSSLRDQIVWDRLSDQPHQHAGRLERAAVRLRDAGQHARQAMVAVAAMPRIWRRYRELERQLYLEPSSWRGTGLALRPPEGNPEALLAAVEELGVRRLLLRLHPWQREHDREESLAAELHRRGYELAFALPQSRELVRDRERWRAAVTELAERFRHFGRHFQVGQAVNRSKWGVWTYREYLELAAEAAEILRSGGEVEILGPAVIDFEPYATAALLNLPGAGLRFDVMASLLYVDRRGAPENRQLGFDTVDKVVLMRAMAETGRNSSSRCWVTEVNWPLWEGPHSPAGRKVAVNEETQADYLVRYYLLALGTGLMERVYWWQLVARGYGLIDLEGDGGLRRRPSYEALRQLNARLEGCLCHGPMEAEGGARLYRFQDPQGEELLVAWATAGPTRVELPRPASEVVGRGGSPLPGAGSLRLEVGPSPCYIRLTD